jgi:N6-adenosine-specific RNA methylase IME4
VADEGGKLIALTEVERRLATIQTVDEARDLRDTAEGFRYYAKIAGKGLAIQNRAAAIKILAERRGGELLAEMEIHGGDRRSGSRSQPLTLKDLNIDKSDSHRWQTMAKVAEDDVRRLETELTASGDELTSAMVYRAGRAQAIKDERVERETNTCTVADLQSLVDAGQTFGTVYADPPWLYGNQGTRAATGNHYGGMTVPEICELPIAKLADDNAHLHLWTTNGFLFESREIIEAWGFAYKSCFVWAKPQMGIGNYWRVSHEFLLLGVRGSLPFADHSLMSWLSADRGRHSEKPEVVRKMIERASPGPRLELFGRRVAQGWTVWGNEIERNMFEVDVEHVA